MKITVQLVIESGDGPAIVTEVATLTREALTEATLGLSLAESKTLLAGVQEAIVAQQAAADHDLAKLDDQLERAKWYLWHGNVFWALQVLEGAQWELEGLDEEVKASRKLAKSVAEFHNYITANEAFIPNYDDRYRYGEVISTGFVESTVNQVISKRMVKKQQMRWTKKGAHLLLQVRTQVLNEDLRPTFERWYPAMTSTVVSQALAA